MNGHLMKKGGEKSKGNFWGPNSGAKHDFEQIWSRIVYFPATDVSNESRNGVDDSFISTPLKKKKGLNVPTK